VDDSLDTYVGNLDPSVGAVRLSDLLSMSSGLSDSQAKLFGVTAPWSDMVTGLSVFNHPEPSFGKSKKPGQSRRQLAYDEEEP